jgi:F0F1-type ATP synthase assembly protein I
MESNSAKREVEGRLASLHAELIAAKRSEAQLTKDRIETKASHANLSQQLIAEVQVGYFIAN